MSKRKQEFKRRVSAASLASLAACLLLMPLEASAEELDVMEARMRLLPGNTPAAGYFRLDNTSDNTVVLVGARSEAFGRVELHRSMNKDGMASMEPVSRLEVAPGEKLTFAPQGYHLMLMAPAGTLSVGDEVEITLEFEQREPLVVDFEAVPPTAM